MTNSNGTEEMDRVTGYDVITHYNAQDGFDEINEVMLLANAI